MLCLGDCKDDCRYLLEQSTAKSKEVRAAALRALARFKDDEAVDTLTKPSPAATWSWLPVRLAKTPAPSWRSSCRRGGEAARRPPGHQGQGRAEEAARTVPIDPRVLRGPRPIRERSNSSPAVRRREEIARLKGDVERGGRQPEGRPQPDFDRLQAVDQADRRLARVVRHGEVRLHDPCRDADRRIRNRSTTCSRRISGRSRAQRRRAAIPPGRSRRPSVAYGPTCRNRFHHWFAGELTVSLREAELDPRWLDAAVQIEDLELVECWRGQSTRPPTKSSRRRSGKAREETRRSRAGRRPGDDDSRRSSPHRGPMTSPDSRSSRRARGTTPRIGSCGWSRSYPRPRQRRSRSCCRRFRKRPSTNWTVPGELKRK